MDSVRRTYKPRPVCPSPSSPGATSQAGIPPQALCHPTSGFSVYFLIRSFDHSNASNEGPSRRAGVGRWGPGKGLSRPPRRGQRRAAQGRRGQSGRYGHLSEMHVDFFIYERHLLAPSLHSP